MKLSRRKSRFPKWKIGSVMVFCHPDLLREIKRIPLAEKRAMMTGEIGVIDGGFRFITSEYTP